MKTKINLLAIIIIYTSTLKVSAQYCGPYGGNRYEIQTTAADPYLALTIGSGTCLGNGSLTFPGMGINVTSPQYMLDILCATTTKQDINISSSTNQVGYRIGGSYVLWYNGITSNIYLGINAGNASSTGIYNTFLGAGTGNSTTSGQGNVAVGYYALNNNSGSNPNAPDFNTAVGYSTMQNNTTGGVNTACGSNALYTNSTGNYNTAIGYLNNNIFIS